MSAPDFPALLQAFFTDRLLKQRRASPHTVAAYRNTFRLLLRFAAARLGRAPSRLGLADLDAAFLGQFLDHLERERGNSARSRNARLAALHAFFRYVAFTDPAHALLCQRILAIPNQRFERGIVEFLGEKEIEALLDAPDPATWIGRRDRALLLVAVQTGLRVSELTALRRQDVTVGTGAHVRCHGSPSLGGKRVTPHTLRHTAAMQLLQRGVDRSVIALWLGHESIETTQVYLHADLRLKEQALARTAASGRAPGRYRPADALLTFLEGL